MRSRSDGKTLAIEYLDALKNQRRLSPATVRNYAHAIDLLLAENASLEKLDPAQARRSSMVRPDGAGHPSMMRRSGSPPVWASIVRSIVR